LPGPLFPISAPGIAVPPLPAPLSSAI